MTKNEIAGIEKNNMIHTVERIFDICAVLQQTSAYIQWIDVLSVSAHTAKINVYLNRHDHEEIVNKVELWVGFGSKTDSKLCFGFLSPVIDPEVSTHPGWFTVTSVEEMQVELDAYIKRNKLHLHVFSEHVDSGVENNSKNSAKKRKIQKNFEKR